MRSESSLFMGLYFHLVPEVISQQQYLSKREMKPFPVLILDCVYTDGWLGFSLGSSAPSWVSSAPWPVNPEGSL